MTAMRKFVANVTLGLPDAGPFAGDGQGPLSIGVFRTALPGGAKIYGSATLPCADAHKLPATPLAGFFYGSGPTWFAAQIDDFAAASETNPVPSGALISVDPLTQQIPSAQKVTVAADAYAVVVESPLELSAILPPDGRPDNAHCPR